MIVRVRRWFSRYKHLQHKYQDLSLKPQHPGYRTAECVQAQLCTVSLARVKTRGRLWFPIGQPSFKFSERPCLKKARWGWREQDT